MVSPHCMIPPLAFRISFQSRHCCSLYHQRHAHDTAYLPHTWAFCACTRFHEVHHFSFFSLCAYTVLILRTKYCLVVGIQFRTGSLRWKKGGRCTAFATRHEEHLSEMEEDNYYTSFPSYAWSKDLSQGSGQSHGFFIWSQFPIFLTLFFFLTRFSWLAISADFLALYSPLVVSYSGLMKLR